MSAFLLNDNGELLLEISDNISFGDSLFLEINQAHHEALLINEQQKIKVGYVHPEVMFFLKKNRYLFVVERTNQFYALNSKLAKVMFVD